VLQISACIRASALNPQPHTLAPCDTPEALEERLPCARCAAGYVLQRMLCALAAPHSVRPTAFPPWHGARGPPARRDPPLQPMQRLQSLLQGLRPGPAGLAGTRRAPRLRLRHGLLGLGLVVRVQDALDGPDHLRAGRPSAAPRPPAQRRALAAPSRRRERCSARQRMPRAPCCRLATWPAACAGRLCFRVRVVGAMGRCSATRLRCRCRANTRAPP